MHSAGLVPADFLGFAPIRRTRRPRPFWVSPLDEGSDLTDFLGYTSGPHLEPWMDDGLCATSGDPDAWFPTHGQPSQSTQAAIAVCRTCPVATICQTYALDRPYLHGIWGGLTDRQRRDYHRHRKAIA